MALSSVHLLGYAMVFELAKEVDIPSSPVRRAGPGTSNTEAGSCSSPSAVSPVPVRRAWAKGQM